MATQIEMPITAQMEKKPDDAFMVMVDKLKGMPPEAISSVLDSYERYLSIQAKQAYETAMAAFKKNIPQIVKRKIADMNGKYSYNYADLAMDVCDKLDPILEAHGFRYSWTTRPNEKGVMAVCIITHLQGHSEETVLPPAPHDNSGGKNALQAIGSTLSYLQRYSILMALGIAARGVDKDGATQAPKAAGGKMEESELRERDEHFDACLTYQEVDAHYKNSFEEAHKLKDQNAKDTFIAAKKRAYARLRAKQ